VFGFGKKKEEPKKEETKIVKQETQSNERKVGDEWIGEFSGTKVKFLYSGPVGEYPGWK
tara:strand:+ start:46 stop:222 length:177 start_codon:yes stop_codon:yes gene_type:complete